MMAERAVMVMFVGVIVALVIMAMVDDDYGNGGVVVDVRSSGDSRVEC